MWFESMLVVYFDNKIDIESWNIQDWDMKRYEARINGN